MKVKKIQSAFTLAELLVLIVIIGILASIVLASYAGITERANNASLAYDLKNASTKLKAYNAVYGSYPASLDANGCPVASGSLPADNNYCVKTTASNSVYNYTGSGQTFSLILKSPTNLYYQSTESVAQTAFTPAPFMQTITNANCPSTRTRAQDARDNKTYWVQKLGDNKCWMLTNLAYGGGGTNTYLDTKTITNDTGKSYTYTAANFYINPAVTSFTIEPNDPSTNTNGSGQVGYYYNFCAANGAQTSTEACSDTLTVVLNPSVSICPSGWRLPTQAEYSTLNNVANGGLTNNQSGLKTNFLVVYGGWYWYGVDGIYYYPPFALYFGGPIPANYSNIWSYWTSQTLATPSTKSIDFDGAYGNVYTSINSPKSRGYSVRCIAN